MDCKFSGNCSMLHTGSSEEVSQVLTEGFRAATVAAESHADDFEGGLWYSDDYVVDLGFGMVGFKTEVPLEEGKSLPYWTFSYTSTEVDVVFDTVVVPGSADAKGFRESIDMVRHFIALSHLSPSDEAGAEKWSSMQEHLRSLQTGAPLATVGRECGTFLTSVSCLGAFLSDLENVSMCFSATELWERQLLLYFSMLFTEVSLEPGDKINTFKGPLFLVESIRDVYNQLRASVKGYVNLILSKSESAKDNILTIQSSVITSLLQDMTDAVNESVLNYSVVCRRLNYLSSENLMTIASLGQVSEADVASLYEGAKADGVIGGPVKLNRKSRRKAERVSKKRSELRKIEKTSKSPTEEPVS